VWRVAVGYASGLRDIVRLSRTIVGLSLSTHHRRCTDKHTSSLQLFYFKYSCKHRHEYQVEQLHKTSLCNNWVNIHLLAYLNLHFKWCACVCYIILTSADLEYYTLGFHWNILGTEKKPTPVLPIKNILSCNSQLTMSKNNATYKPTNSRPLALKNNFFVCEFQGSHTLCHLIGSYPSCSNTVKFLVI